MGKPAGQVFALGSLSPQDIRVRRFECGITDPVYDERLGLTNFRKDTVAFNGTYAASRDAAGDTVAAANGSPILWAAGQTRVAFAQSGNAAAGSVPGSGQTIQGSFVTKDPASFLGYDSGLTPLNRCFAILGIMVHARCAYQRQTTASATTDVAAVTPFLTNASDGFRFTEDSAHQLLERVSISLVNTVDGKTYNMGAANDNPDFLPGFWSYDGIKPGLGAFIPLPCPIIAGAQQTINAWYITATLEKGVYMYTDGTNVGFGTDQSLNSAGATAGTSDSTVYFDFCLYAVGAVACCPPDKLCEFEPGIVDPGQRDMGGIAAQ